MPAKIKKRRLTNGFLITHLWPGFKGLTGKKFVSLDVKDAKPCQVKIVNYADIDVIFCWVDFSGKLYHFSPINNSSISDASVRNVHVENTVVGHSFVGFRSLSSTLCSTSKATMKRKALPVMITDIHASEFVLFYRPEKGHCIHELSICSKGKTLDHISSTVAGTATATTAVSGGVAIQVKIINNRHMYSTSSSRRKCHIIDSTDKVYFTTKICGFIIKYEAGLFDDSCLEAIEPATGALAEAETGRMGSDSVSETGVSVEVNMNSDSLNTVPPPGSIVENDDAAFVVTDGDSDLSAFRAIFTADLQQICELMSGQYLTALRLLQESTVIWVNRSLVYGEGIHGRACCFHAHNGQAWLRSMGCHVEKAGGIEIYSARDYLADRCLWGVGGILMHELSHSYHNQHISGGFDNKTILDIYHTAMAKKLYDRVAVHGKQGEKGPIKAYASTNAMEFFAEISTAYMWGAMCLDCPSVPAPSPSTAVTTKTVLPAVVRQQIESSSNDDRIIADDKNVCAPIGIDICCANTDNSSAIKSVRTEEEEEEESLVLEYNKWFPFNRRQLIRYDYVTYLAIHDLWTQTDSQRVVIKNDTCDDNQ